MTNYMLNIVILPHFFHLKNMLPDNLNKICVRILTLLLFFPISVLLTSSNFTSGKISDFIGRMFDIIFWSAFLSSSLQSRTFFCSNIFQHVESSSWMVMCSSALPFDGNRHDRIILVGRFFGLYLWIVSRYVYS